MGTLSYLLVRLNERIESQEHGWPWGFFTAASVILIATFFLTPSRIAPPVLIAVAGALPLAWSDLNTNFLWDDAMMLTLIATAATDIALGIEQRALLSAMVVGGALMILYLISIFAIVSTERPLDTHSSAIFQIGKYRLIAGDARTGIADVRMAIVIGLALAPVGILWPVFSILVALLGWYFWHNVRRGPVPLGPVFLGALVIGGVAAPLNAMWSFL